MRPTGPIPAGVMIVGEAPGAEEERLGVPFVGSSGQLLDSTLTSIGLFRHSSFVTNVCRHRPPDNDISEWMSENKKAPDPTWQQRAGLWVHPHIADGLALLQKEIELVQPRLIIALGNLALWALTGHMGILKWRGSRLSPSHLPCTVIPTIHPAAVLRQNELLPVFKMDLARAKNIYEGKQLPAVYSFTIEPSFEEVISRLQWFLAQADAGEFALSGDIETRSGHIACIGLAWSDTEAICIPLLRATDGPFYWSLEEETAIVFLLRKIFRHPNILHLGQNYLYDCQYYARHWHVLPARVFDTMIGHHAIYTTLRKGLDFLSSMYCQDHVYWKEESKEWDPKIGERQYWTYNCKDAVITYEAAREIKVEAKKAAVPAHFEFQQSQFFPVLRMMQRGVRLDYTKRKKLKGDLTLAAFQRQELLNYMVGHPLNPKSPKKVMQFFYEDMKIKGIKKIGTERLTANSDALEIVSNREPLLSPVCQALRELRSIGVFLSTFIEAEPDVDGRMRSSFSIAGTITNRHASYENAFGSGMNFQNLPTEEKKKLSRARDYISLPNVREIFIPDSGHEFFDKDLDRADLQVVVWEAEDADLKFALREELDMHLFNAMQVWNLPIDVSELKESHPNYPEVKAKYNKQRQLAKQAVHATDYGVGDYKLAITLGITVHAASQFRQKWFAAHPGIKKWHERTETQARKFGFIENKFGARLYILGRLDLPAALAWTPQSTVAGVISRIMCNIDAAEQRGETSIQLLIQVHDSLAGQYLLSRREEELANLRRLSRIVIPYDDPLIIPVGIKTSTESWGACK